MRKSFARELLVILVSGRLDINENGCSMEVVTQNGIQYVRVLGWDYSFLSGQFTAHHYVHGNILTIPMLDGVKYGHPFDSLGRGDGACHSKPALSTANNDCWFRSSAGIISAGRFNGVGPRGSRCYAYFNGRLQGEMNCNETIQVPGNSFGVGKHTLKLVVTNSAGQIATETRFSVLPENSVW